MIRFENSPATLWIRIDKNLFRRDNKDKCVSFATDKKGNAYRLDQGSKPILTSEKIAWWETTCFHVSLQAAEISILVSIIIAAPVGRFRRRKAEYVKQNSQAGPYCPFWRSR